MKGWSCRDAERPGSGPLICCAGALAALMVTACSAADWRAKAIDAGVQAIRTDLNDPNLRFQAVQVVGDSGSGQICGTVSGATLSTSTGAPVRFIVYIDGTAGPWIEGQHGHQRVSDERFDVAWRNDCVQEGWR